MPVLADGLYAVVWRVTSADGHVVDGAFSFQVGTASTGSGQDLAVFAASAALRGESIAPPASPLFSELAEQLHEALAKSPIVVEWSDA